MNPLYLVAALFVAPLSVFASTPTGTVKTIEVAKDATKEAIKLEVTESPERIALVEDLKNLFLLPKDVDAKDRFSSLEDEELKTLRANLLKDTFDECVKDKFEALKLDFERFAAIRESMIEKAITAAHLTAKLYFYTDDKDGARLKKIKDDKLIPVMSPLKLYAFIKYNNKIVADELYNNAKEMEFLGNLPLKSVANLLKEKLITLPEFHDAMAPGATDFRERIARTKLPIFTRKSLANKEVSVASTSSQDSMFKEISSTTWAFIGVAVVLLAALVVVVVRSVGSETDETDL